MIGCIGSFESNQERLNFVPLSPAFREIADDADHFMGGCCSKAFLIMEREGGSTD
jgi:hypothetical protein